MVPLMQSGKPIRLSDKLILDRFWKLEYSCENPPLYIADPMHAELENRTNMRYIIMPMEMDEVLVVYKVTKTMGKEYIHVIDKPISLNGDAAHENAMIEQLRLQNVIFLFAERHAGLYRNVKRKENYDNYYHDLEKENMEKFSNSRWRRKARIRLLYEDPAFKAICTPDFGEIAVKALVCRREWWNEKDPVHKDTGIALLERSKLFTNGETMHFAIFFKDTCLGFRTELVNKDMSFSTSLYLSRICNIEPQIELGCPRGLLCNLDDCLRHISGKWLLDNGIQRQYCLGFGLGRSNIRRHKETVCDGKIKYYTGE